MNLERTSLSQNSPADPTHAVRRFYLGELAPALSGNIAVLQTSPESREKYQTFAEAANQALN